MAETLKAEAVERMARAIAISEAGPVNSLWHWPEEWSPRERAEIRLKTERAMSALLTLLRERGLEDVAKVLEGE